MKLIFFFLFRFIGFFSPCVTTLNLLSFWYHYVTPIFLLSYLLIVTFDYIMHSHR